MELVRIGNIIEGVFWLLFSLLFWLGLLRKGEKQRWFCVFGGMVFVIFAGSDFYEAHTGAWWLIPWNGLCGVGIGIVIYWYVSICGSISNALKALKKKDR